MVEAIFPNLYKIEVPLRGNPLKAVNSYVITGGDRNLIIDTGLNRPDCMAVIQAGIKELNIEPEDTDFFITHVHADHFALVSKLATDSSRIYFNVPDARRFGQNGMWEALLEKGRQNGFPEKALLKAIQSHPGYKYGARLERPLTLLREGDTIRTGPYLLECVETPGHTRGHMCLYERRMKILFSGDHLLGDITPNIQAWFDDHALRKYLLSLDKVYRLDVNRVLPGHRRSFTNCRGRIEELKYHHEKRAGEVLTILRKGDRHAYDVASEMTWDIVCDSWDQFPLSQKWFAMGEALAHLKYLQGDGALSSREAEGKIIYALNSDHLSE
ncbi:MAG: MBL fold metallo-hydrolase [Deltaproteobacteria bacterium]|nr:MBL fold metallo-hydrolase [Deltaproteobacteria bacterium]